MLAFAVLLVACGTRDATSEPDPKTGTLVALTADGFQPLLSSRPEPVLLVNVWSTWCEPCVAEFPELVAAAEGYAGRGLGVVFISTDAARKRDAVRAFLRAQGAPSPTYVKVGSDTAFVAAIHPEWSGALPATVLFDADRNAKFFWEGPVTRAMLKAPIEQLLPPAP